MSFAEPLHTDVALIGKVAELAWVRSRPGYEKRKQIQRGNKYSGDARTACTHISGMDYEIKSYICRRMAILLRIPLRDDAAGHLSHLTVKYLFSNAYHQESKPVWWAAARGQECFCQRSGKVKPHASVTWQVARIRRKRWMF